MEQDRSAEITVTAGDATAKISVVQKAKVWKTTAFKLFAELGGTPERISSNGRWTVGFQQYNWSWLIDNDALTAKIIEGPEVETVDGPTTECNIYDVSNDGTIVGEFYSPDALKEYKGADGQVYRLSVMVPGIYRDGTWAELPRLGLPLEGAGMDGNATCITPDGAIIGGWQNEGDMKFIAYSWGSQNYSELTRYEGSEEGSKILTMSDDGSVKAGWTTDKSGMRYPAQWINGEFMVLGNEIGEAPTVSSNGRWTGGNSNSVPFVWSEEDGFKTLTLPEGMDGGSITGIANDGTMVGYFFQTGFGQVRYPFVVTKEGEMYDLDEYMETLYGCVIPAETLGEFADAPNEWLCTVSDISADGTVITGWNTMRQPWVLRLGKPLAAQ